MLRSELGSLEAKVRALHPELVARAHGDAPSAERARAAELSRALEDFETAFTAEDPAFAGFAIRAFALGRAGLLPATTDRLARWVPGPAGRGRLVIVWIGDGRSRIVTDEGTPEELEERHAIRFLPPEEIK
jgi:hypothetical protein